MKDDHTQNTRKWLEEGDDSQATSFEKKTTWQFALHEFQTLINSTHTQFSAIRALKLLPMKKLTTIILWWLMQGKDHTREQNFDEISSVDIQPHTPLSIQKPFQQVAQGKDMCKKKWNTTLQTQTQGTPNCNHSFSNLNLLRPYT